SNIRLRVPAGRLGNGVPLTREEVSGHFEIAETRFDMAGDLPAVRDAAGSGDFHGPDLDIALRSGTVYMPTGRSVAASNGTFTIRDARVRPVIGDLAIEVEGDAPSVVAFASYKPTDASRLIDLAPDDFSGEVSGTVKAQI